MVKCCVVIGGGVAGPNAALALAKAGFQCTMYELRDSPSTIGGAINLTPNALRLLKDLGVNLSGCIVESIELFSIHTAQKLGEIPFHKPNGHSMRVLRTNLQTALLNAVSEAGIPIEYGSKLVKVDDQPESDKVTVGFADGKTADADLVLGCDGVHSAVRMQAVEPNRRPEYTGIATAYAIVAAEFIRSDVHFQQTAVNMSQRGSLLTSYIDADKTKIYLAAVMELEEQASKEGWKARGKDRDATLQEIRRRFGDSVLPCLPELVNSVSDFFFYPVFKLSPGGKWHTDRVLLIGDAAHAMPPQGESVGLALEDAILLARVVQECPDKSTATILDIYESTRRDRIDTAYKEANSRWENVKDKSWIQHKVVEFFTLVYLWYNRDKFEYSYAYDVRQQALRV